ncbi:isoleucine--tRNA ligase [Arthrobacter sp. Hiyo4]|nr:isoleucine--tRNA ligase [Arthrobacter sp. Hiyo4]
MDDAGVVTAGGLQLEPEEYTLETVVKESDGGSASVAVLPGGGFVVLNTEITPELEAEGLARDVIRAIQQARKDEGLNVSDRIKTSIRATPEAAAQLEPHRDLISKETLSKSLDFTAEMTSLSNSQVVWVAAGVDSVLVEKVEA